MSLVTAPELANRPQRDPLALLLCGSVSLNNLWQTINKFVY